MYIQLLFVTEKPINAQQSITYFFSFAISPRNSTLTVFNGRHWLNFLRQLAKRSSWKIICIKVTKKKVPENSV